MELKGTFRKIEVIILEICAARNKFHYFIIEFSISYYKNR